MQVAPALIAGSFGPLVSAAPVHPVTPTLAGTADNSWVLVDRGSVDAPRGILAYSGGWYDPQYHQLCIFGGGHWNYSGNEVWCFDIASTTWREMYPPDVLTAPNGDQGAYHNHDNQTYPGALFHPAGEPIEDANPMARHTYDQMEYVEGLGPVVWGGYSWGSSGVEWCVNCPDTWAFDFASARWTYLYDGKNPSPNFSAGIGASAYSKRDGMLYVVTRGGTWTYNPRRNRWREVTTRGEAPSSIEATMEYDPKRHVMYLFGGRFPDNPNLWRLDLARRHWSRLKPSGDGPGSGAVLGPGLAYDSVNDVLLVYHSGRVWVYHPDTNGWEAPVAADSRPADRSAAGVFGRFRYDPVNNGAWFHGWENGEHATWFYRYKG